SWDSTVQGMEKLIDAAIATRRPHSAHTASASEHNGSGNGQGSQVHSARFSKATRNGKRSDKGSVIVVGAGPTGLSAAYHLGSDAILLEQNGRVGGWCRSVEKNGFTFDFAGHIMFSHRSE